MHARLMRKSDMKILNKDSAKLKQSYNVRNISKYGISRWINGLDHIKIF